MIGIEGMYVALEGIQCSGKSTYQRMLIREVVQSGRSVFSTQEPDGTNLGREMRKLIMNSRKLSEGRINIDEEMTRFFEARYDLMATVFELKQKGVDIIVSRCFLSTEVHQIRLGNASWRVYNNCLERLTIKPDLVLVYDLPAEVAMARKNLQVGLQENTFREVELEEMKKRRQAYLDLVKEEAYGLQYVLIDANRPIWEVVNSSLVAYQGIIGRG